MLGTQKKEGPKPLLMLLWEADYSNARGVYKTVSVLPPALV